MTGEHELVAWFDHQGGSLPVASVRYASRDDIWQLRYTPEWLGTHQSFAFSPALALSRGEKTTDYATHTVKRFMENLLPEGQALEVAASMIGVTRSNIFGLIHALGAETTGAFRFLPAGVDGQAQAAVPARQVGVQELDERIAGRREQPFGIWDNKLRMSAAGYQDKLLVFCEGDPAEGDRMYLPDFPLASTYILKPEPFDRREHMVANEHYCMALARALKLPAARTSILRTPRPVLAVARFDRRIRRTSQYPLVLRSHIVDACQALDAPVSYKYERNIGSEQATRLYRDGVSLPRLFSLMDCSVTPAAHKLELVRWLLFQLTIGNSDAHGKNISFGMVQNRLTPAPWYDLVSVVQYPVSHELSMAVGDQFELDNLTAFDIGYFAHVCKVPATVLVREADRLVKGVQKHAAQVVADEPFEEDERGFVQHIADFALQQAARLAGLTREAAKLTTDIY